MSMIGDLIAYNESSFSIAVYLSEVHDIRPGPISDVFVKSFDDLNVTVSK